MRGCTRQPFCPDGGLQGRELPEEQVRVARDLPQPTLDPEHRRFRAMSRSLLTAVLLLSLCGCDASGTDRSACFVDEPVLSIGTGDEEWVELAEGDPVTMAHGPQGGWHILGSARVDNTDQVVSIDYSVAVESTGEVVADNSYRVALVLDEECSGYFPGMYAYLHVEDIAQGEEDTPPELLADQDLVLRMEVVDTAERSIAGDLTVVAVRDPVDLVENE